MKKFFACVIIFGVILISFISVIWYHHLWLRYFVVKSLQNKLPACKINLKETRVHLPDSLILKNLNIKNQNYKLLLKELNIKFSFKGFKIKIEDININKPIFLWHCKRLKDIPGILKADTLFTKYKQWYTEKSKIYIKNARLEITSPEFHLPLVFSKTFIEYHILPKKTYFRLLFANKIPLEGYLFRNQLSLNLYPSDFTVIKKYIKFTGFDIIKGNFQGKIFINFKGNKFNLKKANIEFSNVKLAVNTLKKPIHLKKINLSVLENFFVINSKGLYNRINFNLQAKFKDINKIKLVCKTQDIPLCYFKALINKPYLSQLVDLDKLNIKLTFVGDLLHKKKLEGKLNLVTISQNKLILHSFAKVIYVDNHLYLKDINLFQGCNGEIKFHFKRKKIEEANFFLTSAYLPCWLLKLKFLDKISGNISYIKNNLTCALHIIPTFDSSSILKLSQPIKINYSNKKLFLDIVQSQGWLTLIAKSTQNQKFLITSILENFKIGNFNISTYLNCNLKGSIDEFTGELKFTNLRINNNKSLPHLNYQIKYKLGKVALISQVQNLPSVNFDIINLIKHKKDKIYIKLKDISLIADILLQKEKIETSIYGKAFKASFNMQGYLYSLSAGVFYIKNINIGNYRLKKGTINVGFFADNSLVSFTAKNISFYSSVVEGNLNIKAKFLIAEGKILFRIDIPVVSKEDFKAYNLQFVGAFVDNKLSFEALASKLKIYNTVFNRVAGKGYYAEKKFHIENLRLIQVHRNNPVIEITNLWINFNKEFSLGIKTNDFRIANKSITAELTISGVLKDIYLYEFDSISKIKKFSISDRKSAKEYVLIKEAKFNLTNREGFQGKIEADFIRFIDYTLKQANLAFAFTKKNKLLKVYSTCGFKFEIDYLIAKEANLYGEVTSFNPLKFALLIKLKDTWFTDPFEFYKKTRLKIGNIKKGVIELVAQKNVYYQTANLDVELKEGSNLKINIEKDRVKFSGDIEAKRGIINYLGKNFEIEEAILSLKEEKLPLLKVKAYTTTKNNKLVFLCYDGRLYETKVKLITGSLDSQQEDISLLLGLEKSRLYNINLGQVLALSLTKFLSYSIEGAILKPIERGLSKVLDADIKMSLPFESLIAEYEFKRPVSLRFKLGRYIDKNLYMSFSADIYPDIRRPYLSRHSLALEYYLTKNTLLRYKFEEEKSEDNQFHEVSIKKYFRF